MPLSVNPNRVIKSEVLKLFFSIQLIFDTFTYLPSPCYAWGHIGQGLDSSTGLCLEPPSPVYDSFKQT